MLQYIKEYGKYVEITGYRGVAFDKAEAFLKANRKQTLQNVEIQFFDAELIATQEHLYFAVLNACKPSRTKQTFQKAQPWKQCSMLQLSVKYKEPSNAAE